MDKISILLLLNNKSYRRNQSSLIKSYIKIIHFILSICLSKSAINKVAHQILKTNNMKSSDKKCNN